MNTEQLLQQAEQVMQGYVCRDLEGEMQIEMGTLVHRFFRDHARRLDPGEIMDHMATPMKALAWFDTYRCESFLQRCRAWMDSVDACTLA